MLEIGKRHCTLQPHGWQLDDHDDSASVALSPLPTHDLSQTSSVPPHLTSPTMSFFGIGRPQPTSAEKIAAVEAEMKMMADMHNRCALPVDPLL